LFFFLVFLRSTLNQLDGQQEGRKEGSSRSETLTAAHET
jgi:hypothetical protein